jgi:hypothetical protein
LSADRVRERFRRLLLLLIEVVTNILGVDRDRKHRHFGIVKESDAATAAALASAARLDANFSRAAGALHYIVRPRISRDPVNQRTPMG